MFDPTIFENLKVVLEGGVYEFDLSGEILVTDRKDLVDLAKMSREFSIQFKKRNSLKEVIAEIYLLANIEDLAKEILEKKNNQKPGVGIVIKFFTTISNPSVECHKVENKVNRVWSNRPIITQRLSFEYINEQDHDYLNEVILHFGRKIDEDNIGDITDIIEHAITTLIELTKME